MWSHLFDGLQRFSELFVCRRCAGAACLPSCQLQVRDVHRITENCEFGLLRCTKPFKFTSNPWVIYWFLNSDQDLEVHDSCEVKPSESWCVMFPGMFEEVTSVSTLCTAQVLDKDGARLSGSESSSWALCDVGKRRWRHHGLWYFCICHFFSTDEVRTSLRCAVKPEPPFKVQVTNMGDFYNITWDHSNQVDCLIYMVRIREADGFSEVTCMEKARLHVHTCCRPPVTPLFCHRSQFTPFPRTESASSWIIRGCSHESTILLTSKPKCVPVTSIKVPGVSGAPLQNSGPQELLTSYIQAWIQTVRQAGHHTYVLVYS